MRSPRPLSQMRGRVTGSDSQVDVILMDIVRKEAFAGPVEVNRSADLRCPQFGGSSHQLKSPIVAGPGTGRPAISRMSTARPTA